MNQIKISIIMPVHNTGIYLEEALKTVFKQSLQEFELICVDDSSSDKQTKDILRSYQDRHDNMQIIWLESNVGAGIARNIGFSNAKGEYTIFLDADDLFAEDFLEKMYDCISENQAEVCICGYEAFYINNTEICSVDKYIPDNYKINFNKREDWLTDIPTAPWNKLCRTQFLIQNSIFFQNLNSSNDVFFSCMVLIKAKKRCYVPDVPLVFYRMNLKTQISACRNPVDLYNAVMLVKDRGREHDDKKLLLYWIGALLLNHGILELRHCSNEVYNREFYDLMRHFFNDNFVEFKNYMLSACVENIKNVPYENTRISECVDFLSQLRMTSDRLKKKISEENIIFLWGLGYRGEIFQKFCKEQSIQLQGVTDIRNQNIGGRTDYGNEIVSTEFVLQSDGLIISSNREIFEYLSKRNLRILNLNEFYIF